MTRECDHLAHPPDRIRQRLAAIVSMDSESEEFACARCGQRFVPRNAERLDGEGRQMVDCDEECDAYDQPVTPDEIKLAYEHWRGHSDMSGCAHGC